MKCLTHHLWNNVIVAKDWRMSHAKSVMERDGCVLFFYCLSFGSQLILFPFVFILQKVCFACHGNILGREPIAYNKDPCFYCNLSAHGRGRQECANCNAKGKIPCPVCENTGLVRCFIQLTVIWLVIFYIISFFQLKMRVKLNQFVT